MGTTAEKINRLTQTKSDLKTVINYTGANMTEETTFKEYPKKLHKAYIDILNNGTDDLYDALPKTIDEGTNATLDTEEGKMKLELKPNLINQTTVLPDEYAFVRFLTSSGNQYIDLGLKANENTKIILVLNMTSQATTVMPFGDFTNTSKALTFNIGTSNSARSRWGSDSVVQNMGLNTSTIYNLELSKDGYYVNGVNKWTPTANTFTTENNIHLFIANGSTSGLVGKMYRCKIYDNNTLIKDLIPCYRRTDNKAGMYDIINDDFLINQGTDDFTYSTTYNLLPSVEIPSEIRVVTGDNDIIIDNDDETEQQDYSVTLGLLEYNKVNTKSDYFFKNIPGTILYDNNLIDNEWYLKKVIKKHTFTGDTDDGYGFSSDMGAVVAVNLNPNKVGYSLYKTDIPSDGAWVISDKFEYAQDTGNYEHIYISSGTSLGEHEYYGNFRLYIWHARLVGYSSSLTDSQKLTLVKNWLQQNPFTIYYVAKNPTNVCISETDYPTLKSELEAIYNNAKSYEDETVITQTNDDLPFVLDISALAKIE